MHHYQIVQKTSIDLKFPFSQVIRTKDTETLDDRFGLDGGECNSEKIKKMISPTYWLGDYYAESLLPVFIHIAGVTGYFFGVNQYELLDFLKKPLFVTLVNGCKNTKYFEVIRVGEIEYLCPTAKYEPMKNL